MREIPIKNQNQPFEIVSPLQFRHSTASNLMRNSYFSLLSTLAITCASGQSLFDIATADEAPESIPLTWTAPVGIGYDDDPAAASNNPLLPVGSSSETQQNAFAVIAHEWTRNTPKSVLDWINSLSPGLTRDGAVESYALSIAREVPSAALEWAESINSDSNQSRYASIASSIAREDPQAAREWLESINDSTNPNQAIAEARQLISVNSNDAGRRARNDVDTGNNEPNIDAGIQISRPTADGLFYDQLNPPTIALEAYQSIMNSVSTVNLITDAALALDDRFGFETADMNAGDLRFDASAFHSENKSTSSRRQTQGFRANLDYGLNDHLVIGIDLIYANGKTGTADMNSYGFILDGTINGDINGINWEIGAGLGAVTGNLHNSDASGDQSTGILTAHAALQKGDIAIGGFDGYWEIGIKERIIFRDEATENGGALNLVLHYDNEAIATTLASIELGISLTDKILLQLALNPVIFHSGGNVFVDSGPGPPNFSSPDNTGYDVHTARAGLRAIVNDTTTFKTDVIIGNDSSWGASIGFSIDL